MNKPFKIAILGFGREGKAILGFIKKYPPYRGAEIFVLDKNDCFKIPKGVNVICGEDYLKKLSQFNVIFRSPGVPYLTPELQAAAKAGAEVTSATKLFFQNAPGKIVGITGTKGKGTTCTLLYEILKAAKFDAHLVGNIGKPALDTLPKLNKNSVTVFELSSFQLQDLNVSPRVAAVLDIFPDHMDSHASFEEYVDAKANIAKHQKSNDDIFYFAEDALSVKIGEMSAGRKHPVSPKGFNIFQPDDLKIPGHHNYKNAVMAANIATHLGVAPEVIKKTVMKFGGLEHRLEFVRVITNIANKRGNNANRKIKVKFYNDSGGTNPQTAAAAVRAFQDPVILIAGGKDKNLDYAPLAEAIIQSKNVLAVILIGENRGKIRKQLKHETHNMEHKTKITECETLNAAVQMAYRLAQKYLQSTHSPINQLTIVFSPASASFDMFKDYAERGRTFKKLVKRIR